MVCSDWWTMKTCSGCRFCCYSWAVDVPELHKSALRHCAHECSKGCALHPKWPSVCESFHCPWQEREGYHRPDTFQAALESAGGDIGNYIPMVPLSIDADWARRNIHDTRTVPACVIDGGRWVDLVLPLDRDADGGWTTKDPALWKL